MLTVHAGDTGALGAHLASRAGGARMGVFCRARKPDPFSPNSAMDVSCKGVHTRSCHACMHRVSAAHTAIACKIACCLI